MTGSCWFCIVKRAENSTGFRRTTCIATDRNPVIQNVGHRVPLFSVRFNVRGWNAAVFIKRAHTTVYRERAPFIPKVTRGAGKK